ncbi:3-deoxy-D-manno-octulosonic acid transferase [Shimia sagamensis]|uniref:3-deoxy-D-manno-octulosonic acid transferase n=1 Tax=Shimia sagamensis TaxID=1566352 RepID=A0ABY1PAJ9_9RHOB|nr:glycosyltransferase N-terminal domain-containing protein [Shimia sagamensis]SMP30147.1 3-deoxy-D-manno-octulosonic-acid transferase [Shimia sagamensis]
MANEHNSAGLSLGWQLRSYLMLRPVLQPVMRAVVARRVAKGKDDPARAQEKLGQAGVARPEGTLIWLHAVGLGEVLALRPLLRAMGELMPEAHFLVTSTARSSAQVLGANLPPRVIHQFLPLDGPRYVARFLDHWQPDLSIWSEQDLWPGAIVDTARRGIPLAYINARITQAGFERRHKVRAGFKDLMQMFALVAAQEPTSAGFLRQLGVADPQVMPSLKPAAAPLNVNAASLGDMRDFLAGRCTWVVASSHAPDEAVAIAAHKDVLVSDPNAVMIIAPRAPDRGADICKTLMEAGLGFAQRSRGQSLEMDHQVYVADTLGELGLWYRLAQVALIGGSFGDTEGHNPWEAIAVGCPVMCGPNTANFAQDYLQLEEEGLAHRIAGGDQAARQLASRVREGGHAVATSRAKELVANAQEALLPLAQQLLSLRSK